MKFLPNISAISIKSAIIDLKYAGAYQKDVLYTAYKAYLSGAKLPLHYLGIGMTSVVFCDSAGFAWKVARQNTKVLYLMLEREFEFFRDVRTIPRIAKHILRVYGFNKEHVAIMRECLWGAPGYWADESKLLKIHELISEESRKIGWTPPEFKEDSYVYPSNGRPPVLVDGGFSFRIGKRLVQYVKDVTQGIRRIHEKPDELISDVKQAVSYKEITKDLAESLIERLEAMK